MEEYILYVALALALLAIIFFFILNIRLNRMIRKYQFFMQSLGDKDVENLMTSYLNEMEKLKEQVHGDMHERIKEIETKLPFCIQNVGIVHYNAFDNVGNEMSFSAAMLDDNQDGYIITGIYSREHSYVYTKDIQKGKPQREFSKEEIEALNRALSKK
jgi:hypothetical protein